MVIFVILVVIYEKGFFLILEFYELDIVEVFNLVFYFICLDVVIVIKLVFDWFSLVIIIFGIILLFEMYFKMFNFEMVV